jgi:pimeloyl-ACP methyl ester carboxylesterase
MKHILLASVCASVLAGVPVVAQQAGPALPPLTIEKQGSFFIGGHDVWSAALSLVDNYPPSGTVTSGQMYVHFQVPVQASRYSLVLVHGCCLTGKTWETTPDGRMGWDDYFVHKGYPTYVVDQPSRGRSAGEMAAVNGVKQGQRSADQLPTVTEASHEGAWTIFRFGPEYPKTFAGVQFPIESVGEFWKQMVPDWNQSLPTPNPTVAALSELARRLERTVLISHSQSGRFPFFAAEANPAGISGIISIEPGGCPSATGDMKPYLGIPALVVFGDYIDQSPRWTPRLKDCRDFVAAAKRAGASVELLVLPEEGIHGNTHMLMQDRNNLEIADRLLTWIGRAVEKR